MLALDSNIRVPALDALAAAASSRIDGWVVLFAGVATFVLVELRCRRASHLRCTVKVVTPLLVSVVLALLAVHELSGGVPSSLGALLASVPRSGTPSSQAAALAAATAVLTAAYGWRAVWFWLATLTCGAAQVSAAHHTGAEILQGWLVGAGCGMLLYAAVRALAPDTGAGERE